MLRSSHFPPNATYIECLHMRMNGADICRWKLGRYSSPSGLMEVSISTAFLFFRLVAVSAFYDSRICCHATMSCPDVHCIHTESVCTLDCGCLDIMWLVRINGRCDVSICLQITPDRRDLMCVNTISSHTKNAPLNLYETDTMYL